MLVASLCTLGSISAAAQLTGQFYLEKETFARGEPVFLYFSLVNKGLDTEMIDPEQSFCSGISITVSSDSVPTFSCPSLGGQSCNGNGPLSRPQPLLPGQTYTGRFLLNFNQEINAPGEYWVDAKRNSVPNNTEYSVFTKVPKIRCVFESFSAVMDPSLPQHGSIMRFAHRSCLY